MNRNTRVLLFGEVSPEALAIALTLVAAVPAGTAAAAGSMPAGGQYVAGNGSFAASKKGLTINQSSATGIIDWNSFSISKNRTVTIDNGTGATLNRVSGGAAATIAGTLDATGSVSLEDSAGIVIGRSGKVVTGGAFVASTDGVGETRHARGIIANAGQITASSVTLTGGSVRTGGSIAVMRGGRIWLAATHAANIDGSLNAENASGQGGSVVVSGPRIMVGGSAHIDASGTSGGTVLIGGDIHGGAIAAENFVNRHVATARNVDVAAGASIVADGTRGQGGNVVVWSNHSTLYQGTIQATGSTKGGFTEVSSHGVLGFEGTVDLTGTAGAFGKLLLDPENVTISNAATSNGSLTGGAFMPSGDNSILNVSTLQTALQTADVEVTTGSSGAQAGNITVAAPIAWSAHTLTLAAYNSIFIDAALAASGTAGFAMINNDGGSGGTIAYNGGNITFASTSESLAINGNNYTLLNSMGAVQNINSNLSGNYALANSLDASSVTGWIPIGTAVPGSGFTGSFTGLGNTISNLSVRGGNYVGLFGYSNGFISDVGMAGGNFSGYDYVGSLMAGGKGTVTNSWSSAAVSGKKYVGGLVGSGGNISDSYETGNVVGANEVGGLAGFAQTITDSYATGSVAPPNLNKPRGFVVGGLVGKAATIIDCFALGNVTGFGEIGGLVGFANKNILNSYAMGSVVGVEDAAGLAGRASGTVSDSYATGGVSALNVGGLVFEGIAKFQNDYFDIKTTGVSSTQGWGNGITGVLTSQLRGALPTGFAATDWGTGPGLLPYLLWQFPSGTPQAVSGTAYTTGGAQAASGETIQFLVNGTSIGSAVTGSQGFYYALFAPGTIAAGGADVIAYTTGTGAAANVESATGSLSNVDLVGGLLIAPTTATTYSSASATSLQSQDASLISGAVGSNSSVQSLVAGFTAYGYLAQGAGFTVDAPVSQSAGLYIDTTGKQAGLTVNDAIDLSGSTGLFLHTNVLAIDAPITATVVDLNGATVTQNAAGIVTAQMLTGSFHTSATLNDANQIGQIGLFTSSGGVSITDAAALTVIGELETSGGTIAITTTGTGSNITLDAPILAATVDLVSSGSILENNYTAIQAGTLTGSSVGSATFVGSNTIAALGAFSTTNGALALMDAATLGVNGAVNAGSGTIGLTVTGAGNTLGIDAPLTGSVVTLVSPGAVSQNSAGVITASTLGVTFNGSAQFTAANAIANLGTIAVGSNASFSLTNSEALTVIDPLRLNGTGVLTLTTTGAASNLVIDAALNATNLVLNAGGQISQGASGLLTASQLTGSAGGAVMLQDANLVKDLGNFTTSNSAFSFSANKFTVNGTVNAGSGAINLSSIGSSGVLTIAGTVESTGTVNLHATADDTETSTGAILAGTLNVTAITGITLTSTLNNIGTLGIDTTQSGPNKVTL